MQLYVIFYIFLKDSASKTNAGGACWKLYICVQKMKKIQHRKIFFIVYLQPANPQKKVVDLVEIYSFLGRMAYF